MRPCIFVPNAKSAIRLTARYRPEAAAFSDTHLHFTAGTRAIAYLECVDGCISVCNCVFAEAVHSENVNYVNWCAFRRSYYIYAMEYMVFRECKLKMRNEEEERKKMF